MARILIVDDSPSAIGIYKKMLLRLGYDVVGTAFSGVEGVKQAEVLMPDIVLLDIVMPGSLDGIAAAEIMKDKFDIPVVFLTAYSEDELIDRAKQVEPLGYLIKPFRRRELKAAIEIALYRREMERRLRETDERFRFLAETTGDAFYQLRYDSMTYDYISQGIATLTGYTPAEINTRSFSKLVKKVNIPGEGDAPVDLIIQCRILGQVGEYFADYLIETRSGEMKWLADHSFPWTDDRGQVIGSVGILTDITARKKAEEAYRESEQRLAAVFRQTPAMIVITTLKEGRYLEVNEAFERISGYTRHEALGKTSLELGIYQEPKDREDFVQRLQDYGEVRNYEVTSRDRSGRKIERLVFAVPITYREEPCILSASSDITELKRAQRVLADKQARLNAIIDSAPLAIWSLDRDLCYRDFNAAFGRRFREITGVELREGMRANSQLSPGGAPKWEEQYQRALKGERVEAEHAFKVRGEDLFVRITFGPIRSESGEITGALMLGQNITDQKLAQEALRRSEERFVLALEATRDGLWDWNPKTGEVYFSPRYYTMLGYAPNELPPSYDTWTASLHPEDREGAIQKLESCIHGASNYESEFRLKTKSGEWRWILGRGKVVEREADGRALRIVGTYFDITERKESEANIRHLNNILRSVRRVSQLITREKDRDRLIANACDVLVKNRGYSFAWIVLTDDRGSLLAAAQAGFSEDRLPMAECLEERRFPECVLLALGRPGVLVLHPAAGLCRGCPLSGKCGSRGVMTSRLHHDGVVYGAQAVSLPTNFVFDAEEQELFGELVADISYALYNLEQENKMKRLEAQIRQTQKIQAIGTLAGGIAHDFNNILFPIMGYSEMTMDDVTAGTRAHRNLEAILKAANRAKDLVRQILTFTRQTDHVLEPLALQPLVKESLKLLRASLPTTIEIRADIDPSGGPVRADATQIHQIIMNLCINASQAMAQRGGTLKVDMREIELDSHQDAIRLNVSPGKYIRLTVSDTGCGMEPHVMDRIFDPYFTTKALEEGTGLGLSMVHGIVHSYSGAIEVTSQLEAGTTFQIYLPIVLGPAAVPEPKPVSSHLANRESILVVDDEREVATVIQLMLETLGYQVTALTDSLSALEMFRSAPEAFDLVITDLTMPQLRGDRLSRKLLEVRPDIPIILCTGFDTEAVDEIVMGAAIREYLTKPVVKDRLAEAVRRVLDQDKGK
ncbi:MAG: PAS domain S-box protein [Deltaproteobacteria bacterium]|nr:PAS domain S-box protein [Deltaproteobacteria bacterium]